MYRRGLTIRLVADFPNITLPQKASAARASKGGRLLAPFVQAAFAMDVATPSHRIEHGVTADLAAQILKLIQILPRNFQVTGLLLVKAT